MKKRPTIKKYTGGGALGYAGAAYAGYQGLEEDTSARAGMSDIDKARGVINTQNSVQGAIPVYGQFQAMGQKLLRQPIQKALDKSNPKLSFVLQNVTDPANYIGYAANDI